MSDEAQILLLCFLFVIWYVVSVIIYQKRRIAEKRRTVLAAKPTVAQLEAELFTPIDLVVKQGENAAYDDHFAIGLGGKHRRFR